MKYCIRIFLFLGCTLLVSCERSDPAFVQGYVEGEFVYVAAPFGAQLQTLAVDRGTIVKAGAPLFALDHTPQQAARDEAARRVDQAKAQLDDATHGQRPTEIDALRAQLSHAQAALVLSQKELTRQTELLKNQVNSQRDFDTARSQRDQDQQQVAQLSANLATAQLGSREAQITAATENVKAQEAALAAAEWNLAQMTQSTPVDSIVSDVLFRPGDWVGAGLPVVQLLPPANVKVRTFVAQAVLGRLHVGDPATVSVDGVSTSFPGKITFISPRTEYTPPVIYSQQMREKFVYLIELSFAPETAAKLHPGQPVDVRLSLATP
ncbi:MAG TPA: HlyD family efflux transporter periplasmic adaptor subunit [Verrucomicrobiae bacterium]|jgi:HlyD family secretion protein